MPGIRPQAVCTGCGKKPEELEEYQPDFTGSTMSPDNYVWNEEGTLNRDNGHFLCTTCYLRAVASSTPRGWVAP